MRCQPLKRGTMRIFKALHDKFIGLITSRMFLLGAFLMVLMCLIVYRLFVLQIVNGASYQENFTLKIERQKTIKATRGTIYDRNGKVLAQDKLAYSVTIEDNYDSNATRDMDINNTIIKLIKIVEKNGDRLNTDFDVILNDDGRYQYTVKDKTLLRFLADCYGRTSTDKLLIKEKNATPDELMSFLCSKKMFGVGRYTLKADGSYAFVPEEGLTKAEILKIITIRFAMNSNSYQKYIATTVATDVNEKTVAEVMENKDTLQGVDIAEDTVRTYINDPSMSHILGYTGKISDEELAELNSGNDSSAYSHKYELNDMVGKSGIEQVMEKQLQGTKGQQTIFVDNLGRVTETGDKTDPTAGNDLYLTIDSDLQSAVYKILEQKIAGIVISKIRNIKEYTAADNSSAADIVIPIDSVYYALFDNNVISLKALAMSNAGDNEKQIYAAYQTKLASVRQQLDAELTQTATPYDSLDKEMQVYESYIVSMLQDSETGIFNKDKVDEKDSTYTAWIAGTASLRDYLKAAIANGWIDISKLDTGNGYSDSDEIYTCLVSYIKDELGDDSGFTKKIVKYMIADDNITGYQICMTLFEQGILQDKDNDMENLKNGTVEPYQFMLARLKSLEITPAQLALDPCSGSCVVTDCNSGEVLALVSYPSYDNNRLANSIDADYYNALTQDKSLPLYDYATQQKTAPGSTFKPVTTTAGLEEGVITPTDTIDCTGVFEKIKPSPHCWIYPHGTHGLLNVVGGIKNSCNFFFYEVGYRLSMTSGGVYDSATGLAKIRKYADMYGLTDKSGVEITESEPQVSDQDSVRSAIGQGNHSYTTVQLARYATAVTNEGVCYNLSLLDKLVGADGTVLEDYKPTVRNNINVASSTWNAIHEGMREAVTTYHAFDNFPMIVAGKTGTAQQVTTRPNHALFIGFAPFDNPKITIATRIAYGYTSANAAEVSRDVMKYYFKLENANDIIPGTAVAPDSAAIGD